MLHALTDEATKRAEQAARVTHGERTGEWPEDCGATTSFPGEKSEHICLRDEGHDGNHWCQLCAHEWENNEEAATC